MNKIRRISEKGKNISISWAIGVTDDTDIMWHNAVILATVMSRGVDVAKQWNGTIIMVQSVGSFPLNEPPKIGLNGIGDSLTVNAQVPIKQNISETVNAFTLNDPKYFGLNTISDYVNTTTTEETI